ncbi:Uncharacterized conserved protein, DUF58 family, contains vWF domain [Rubritalea squalenifaciens DSM 18772]|uniref:Uncharacterized conserved protein, DUF58 family, contains vWF domain n=1 Tax=Rubritalea squalenifaciens DSM 18772 TaxID=1123071 RepID=A0A1M6MAX1_9BACT|nr:DUF58 domain-containing protein [Rubritalea squalenifaciens]SHJ80628.1 Uncharacterized conserved protein, DUF58 family, contains vWF domain [Rubritalea squalenifaciens DSM 18772]
MPFLTDSLAVGGFAGFLLGVSTYVGPVIAMILIWRYLKLKPSGLMLWCATIWLMVGVLASVFGEVEKAWWILAGLWALVALIDAIWIKLIPSVKVQRTLPGRFAIGVAGDVTLKVSNSSRWPLSAHLYDGLPEEGACELLPWSGTLPGKGYQEVTYPATLHERGMATFDEAHVQVSSPFRFWVKQQRIGEKEQSRVYPNYEPVIRFALLTMESSPEQMGIVMKNRVGLSKDFHQLRDYHLGDMLSQIDWKATSKRLSLISRDYQEQRDQNVILAIDCGRRMRAMDGEMPQFDHCLNAMLLLAYVALRQGDNVGILSFGGEERWLPPVKGVNSMTTILNHLYDYQTSTNPSDYAEAVEKLMVRQRRRALVVVLSNVRGEDGADLIQPLQMLRKRHVVMLANLREKEVVDAMEAPIATLDDALKFGATQRYLDDRRLVLNELNAHGIQTVDTTAKQLPVALANRYLATRQEV